jgi:NAD(P)-dependent dehydrogenase (short-subunit alcohol dehydrogenase family)
MTIVVTGGSGGIGRIVIDTALETSDRRCACLDLQVNQSAVESERVLAIQCDVTDPAQVTRAIDDVVAWGGPITGLVNSVGTVHHEPTLELGHADWRRVLGVHLDGTFLASQAVARKMAQGDGGAIVNMGSVAMHFGWPERLAYSAAKGAIGAMTRTLAVEWAHLGIRVNCVAPGYIESELVADLVERAVIDGETYRICTPSSGSARPVRSPT